MQGEESPQNNVPLFLQHWQGHRTRDYVALLALVLVGDGGRKYNTQNETQENKLCSLPQNSRPRRSRPEDIHTSFKSNHRCLGNEYVSAKLTSHKRI